MYKDIESQHEPFILEVTRYFPLPEGVKGPVTSVVKVVRNQAKEAIACKRPGANLRPYNKDEDEADLETAPGSNECLDKMLFLAAIRSAGFSNSLESLRLLKVLDLGCGSENFQTMSGAVFPPGLCRILHRAQIDVTGVDREFPRSDANGNGEAEDWKFHQLDLSERRSLDIFPDNSFDVINAMCLIGHTESGATSPCFIPGERHVELEDPDYQAAEGEIFKQVLRMLKPGGIFIVNGHRSIYQKCLGEDMIFRFSLKYGEGFENLPYTYLDAEGLVFQGDRSAYSAKARKVRKPSNQSRTSLSH